MPFFSFIIPVYNKADYIQRSFNSILNQTFQDFEIIAVNDASTDGSLEEINKFSDNRIRVFHRDNPGPGGYAARNLGIKEAKGEWIAFLDADDEWNPGHLSKMVKLSKEFPNVNVLGCGWIKKTGAIVKNNKYYDKHVEKKSHPIDLVSYLKACANNALPLHTNVVCIKRTSFISELFPANTSAQRGGDQYAWTKLMCHYKLMAWSSHIGAIYNRDIVGQIINTSPISTILINRNASKTLSKGLTSKEKRLLKKYFNVLLRNTIITSVRLKQKRINVLPHIHVGGNLIIVAQTLILSITPTFLLFPLLDFLLRKSN